MGVFDDVKSTPAKSTTGGVFSSVTPAPAPTGGVFSNVTPAPNKNSTTAPLSPYFQGKEPTGTFLGISDQVDPSSGRPFLAYRLPGATSTTTDTTRVAPKIDPEVAAPTDKENFENPRMSESASQQIRKDQGATKDEQLDHRMALSVGGSNDSSNLKVIPTKDNQAASTLEGQLPSEIANGKLSLFQAQLQEAQNKGLPIPFTDAAPAQPASLWDKITSGVSKAWGAAKGAAVDAAQETVALGKEGYDAWSGFVNKNILQPYATAIEGAGEASADVSAALQNTDGTLKSPSQVDWANASANELKLITSAFGAASVPGMAPFTVANAIPGVGHVLDPVNWLFGAAGAAGGTATKITQPIINRLPISQNDKDELNGAIEGTGSTLAQFAVGAYLFGRAGQALETKGNPLANFKDLTLKDVTDIVDSTKKFAAQVKAQLPQNLQQAQRGFVRIPGLGNLPEEGKTPQENKTPATPEDAAGAYYDNVLKPQIDSGKAIVIGADDLKDYFGGDYDLKNHPIYSKASNDLLMQVASENKNPKVIMTAGGPGSGKTELVKQEVANGFDGVVYDSNLGSYDGAKAQIDALRAMGKEPEIHMILRDPRQAYHFTKLREAVGEHPVSEGAFVRNHAQTGVPDTVARLAEDDNVPVKLVDVRGINSPEGYKNLEYVENPVARLKNTGYNEENLGQVVKTYGTKIIEEKDALARIQAKRISASREARSNTEGKTAATGSGKQVFRGERVERSRTTNLSRENLIKAYENNGFEEPKYPQRYGDLEAAKARAPGPNGEIRATDTTQKRTPPPIEKEAPTHGGNATRTGMRSTKELLEQKDRTQPIKLNKTQTPPLLHSSYDPIITEHNGGVEPPENKGGQTPPEIDWTEAKDKAAIRLSTDTMERNVEKIFPAETANKINDFLVEPTRKAETKRVEWATKLREDTKAEVVDKLGIKSGSLENRLIQQFGEGRLTLDELKEQAPKTWQNVVKASAYFRKVYDDAISRWNFNRGQAGLAPIGRLPNYFRHFIDLGDWVSKFGFNFSDSKLPTAISGITEFFRSQTPWASASMRRLGSTFTDDALGGLDNFIDNTSRAIFHTDSVQRGRLLEKYLREAASANQNDIKLANFASNLNDWTNLVSGKQAKLDRAVESVFGRAGIQLMSKLSRQFGLNVIGGNLSAATTHLIPLEYTLATTGKGALFQGMIDTLRAPFLDDFNSIDGTKSDFLTRRFGKQQIEPTLIQKGAHAISMPFHWVDQFISRMTVSAKYTEGIHDGLSPQAAMKAADNYAGRVIGDRSTGNLPNLMNTKTLKLFTQFMIEVNDNLHVMAHDIPRWEDHNIPKVAMRLGQLAVFSFLFNQTFQYIKGSGKGLDPIDMALTLAGLNDEGKDKSVTDRLLSVGQDLAQELPFTSTVTGGQIPAFTPLSTAAGEVGQGQYLKALEGIAASFASPIGGGQQLQKSLTAIQAWRQGYVTDSQGHITAMVPQTIPSLAQGVAFGKNAFPTVKKSNSEITALDGNIKAQQASSKLKDQQAANIWQELKGMPQDQAKDQLKQIATEDPDMAKRVLNYAKDEAAGLTKTDILMKSLGIENGQRASYIVQQMEDMNEDEKKTYLKDLATKKILTSAVLNQVASLLKNQ